MSLSSVSTLRLTYDNQNDLVHYLKELVRIKELKLWLFFTFLHRIWTTLLLYMLCHYLQDIYSLPVSMGKAHISCRRSFCNDSRFFCFTFWGSPLTPESHHSKIREKERQNKKSFNFSNCPPFYLQSTGTFFATARYGSATPVPPSVVSRGAGWLVCLCDISFTYCVSFLHFRPKIYCFISWKFVWFSGNRGFAQWHVWRCYWRFCISVLMKLKPFMKFFPKQTITCYVSLLCFASFIVKMLVYWHWLELEVEESSKYQQDSCFSSLYLVC